MRKYSFLFLATILTGIAVHSSAQESTLLHFMRQSPQSLRTNPANLSDSVSFFMGIPIFSNISVDFLSGFAYSDAIMRDAQDSLRINRNFSSSDGHVDLTANVEVLSFGFRFAKKNMITFSTSIKAYGSTFIPSDAASLLIDGNNPDRPLALESQVKGSGYVELALGYARTINQNWKAGVRAKYLVGLANADADKMHATIRTSPVDYAMTVNTDALLRTSYVDKAEDIFSNNGFGIDAGVYYKSPIQGLEFSLSMIDWGMISWKTNLANYQAKMENGEYTFRGLESLDDNSFDAIIDTLENALSFDDVDGTSYTASLPGKIFLGASYNLTEKDKFGFLFSTQALHNFNRTMFALMYNRSVGKWLTVAAGNNFYMNKGFNPSLAFNVKLGGFQLYMVGENISNFDVKNIRSINFQFGMNITLMKNKKKSAPSAEVVDIAAPMF